jgi:SAM-dependent methyltransferase
MVFLANPPDYAALSDTFEWSENWKRENKRRAEAMPKPLAWINRKTRWRLRKKAPQEARRFNRVFPDGNLLDVGCGAGREISSRHVPFGIEISPILGARAQALYGARGGKVIIGASAETIGEFPPGFFAGVILTSILEHEKAPLTLLKGVRRALRADGAVFVKVPNYGGINRHVMGAEWAGFRYPDHVNYFTAETLQRMSHMAGFGIRRLDRWAVFDDNLKAILVRD